MAYHFLETEDFLVSACFHTLLTRMENSYNAQFYTSAELEPIFVQVFGSRLHFCGFETIGPRKWIRETQCGFKYFFHLNPQHNGYSYLPCGAISLDFVPRIVAGRLKIQPKPKNVAVHFSFEDKKSWDWMIDKNREGSREKIEKIAGESVTAITGWFQQFKSLDDVAAAFARTKARSSATGFYCYPSMAMAYAFALARLGKTEAARSEFEQAITSSYWGADLHSELRTLFESEIKGNNSQAS